MTLVKVRAALEKSITDEILAVKPSVKVVYDNVAFTTPSKSLEYVVVSVNFGQATKQNQLRTSKSMHTSFSGFTCESQVIQNVLTYRKCP